MLRDHPIEQLFGCSWARHRACGRRGPASERQLVSTDRAVREVYLQPVIAAAVGASLAIAGPIGFVGLIVPHTLRALIGPDHRALLPASIFGGAILLVLCDTLARTAIAPAHLPTGAVTAVLGGPFFVFILMRQKQRAALWGGA